VVCKDASSYGASSSNGPSRPLSDRTEKPFPGAGRAIRKITHDRRHIACDAAWAALEQAVIGKAVDLLSGPGGLASFLRRRQLGARLAGPSLPPDIGYAETVPAGIRNAVMLRGQRCQWAGGCNHDRVEQGQTKILHSHGPRSGRGNRTASS
jgi:hypothetical protein